MKPKIDTARAWGCLDKDRRLFPWADETINDDSYVHTRVRIIRERDYRKLVKAASKQQERVTK
jgi:hypothetical protein